MNLARVIACVTLTFIWFSSANAGSLPEAKNETILTISGNIENTNAGLDAQFDRDMLETLGLETVETSTPWYDGKVRFEGVSLQKLMTLVGAKGSTVTAIALNDYSCVIPLEDFKKYHVILALKRDGKYMAIRDKGPLFIVYPYDSDSQLQNQLYYTRSAWQVAKLRVE
ncbi:MULTISPECIES: oxidoreductase [Rhizobium]|uniref:Oxidoreductase n=1 Tax=Rhizobium rhododendri TaxID=2506430 RepID=A0ABY8ING5_9HYPH|nr:MULTISPECIES: oxidoreductase [Rhizobium]MBO9135220.1 oxidoreductase [Rhizobium sp. B209b/85]MBO9186414.1 oxidoreductase [Rhizobium sp. E27B/91]MBZ5762000.1 oxidoreductase [Rhizobium sp. VS19-DR96]MBZ5768354.1 oxidoreductase [Rhizobium sp. VS19-DR129.2]MBZ5775624.1 oxidoreductase [Rhizobium sp. VS19-DRK62.2]